MDQYDFSRLAVLVVDDSYHMRRLVKTILEAFGCTNIYEAESGPDALDLLAKMPIDVVVLDWLMDPMDGIETTRRIRSGGEVHNPYVPVIMLTGHTTMSCILAAREAGVTEYLAKPVTPKGLMSRLQLVIEKPRPFVRTSVFFGPDRRRKDSSFYRGPERREDEKKPAQKTADEANMFEIEDSAEDAA